MLLLTVVAAAGAAAPSSADAAPWRCEASALTGSVLGGKLQLPAVRANAGAADCSTQTAGLGVKLPAPLDTSALVATTSLMGSSSDPASQSVISSGGIADLKVGALPDLGLTLPPLPIPNELKSLTVNVPAVPNPLPGQPDLLPATPVVVDLTAALNALQPSRLLPTVDLLRVKGAMAYASAACVGGKPQLNGASEVLGINVLGTELPVGQVVDQTLRLVDSGSIDPSNVDLSKVTLPASLPAVPQVKAAVDAALKQALDALPTITIPAELAQIKVTPGDQSTVNGLLTQRALRIQIGLLGQSIIDTTIGEASVGAGDVNCAPDPLLECSKKALVLVDVYEKNNRVKLVGVAHRKYAGKMVDIVFEATGNVVARAKVGRDGKFDTDTALPKKTLRAGNEARYMAKIGSEKSMNLKLARRMLVDEMVARNGRVTISGRITGLMAKGEDREILVTRQVSCTKKERVTTFKPESDGTFSVSFKAPTNTKTAVYRLSTLVRKSSSNPKTFPTYTLPRAVNLLGL
jgi:hypothetical protein